jgi:hypothetical protein
MGRSVRIPEGAARTISAGFRMTPEIRDDAMRAAICALRDALVRLDRIPKRTLARRGSPPKDLKWNSTPGWARKPSKEEKRDRRSGIREKVFKRAEVDGVPHCEGPMYHLLLGTGPEFRDIYGRCENNATQLAHAFGRGKGRMPESERNCMGYCNGCARQETNNRPSAEFWWNFRAAFFEELGFTAEAREARKRQNTTEVKGRLPAAPRVDHAK